MKKRELEKLLYSALLSFRASQAELWELGGKKIYNDVDSMDFINEVCNPSSRFVEHVLDNI